MGRTQSGLLVDWQCRARSTKIAQTKRMSSVWKEISHPIIERVPCRTKISKVIYTGNPLTNGSQTVLPRTFYYWKGSTFGAGAVVRRWHLLQLVVFLSFLCTASLNKYCTGFWRFPLPIGLGASGPLFLHVWCKRERCTIDTGLSFNRFSWQQTKYIVNHNEPARIIAVGKVASPQLLLRRVCRVPVPSTCFIIFGWSKCKRHVVIIANLIVQAQFAELIGMKWESIHRAFNVEACQPAGKPLRISALHSMEFWLSTVLKYSKYRMMEKVETENAWMILFDAVVVAQINWDAHKLLHEWLWLS